MGYFKTFQTSGFYVESQKYLESYCSNESLGWVVASESTALSSIHAEFVREVEPGQIIEITSQGVQRVRKVTNPTGLAAFCIFEYVYFAKADSIFEGQQVYQVRYNCGVLLAREAKVEADLVSCVPDSSFPSALGYATESGLQYKDVFAKNNYVGRTFIQPSTMLRQQGINKKFSPIFKNFINKRVVLIDDSIVRGNTMQQLVKLLKDYGASEVHIRIASPPIKYPCFMGINIPTKEELIANVVENKDLGAYFGADSVVHLSIAGLKNAVRMDIDKSIIYTGHCTACLDGEYPVLPENLQW
uniref:Phosphoribosyltransferase domain-containing protein n=1 Tax=Romanomermis culicivorax TaxID=13658 RepID=A0A915JFC3_ROMCU